MRQNAVHVYSIYLSLSLTQFFSRSRESTFFDVVWKKYVLKCQEIMYYVKYVKEIITILL